MTNLQLGDDPLISGFQDIRPLYILPDDPFLEEFLVPAFASSLAVDCMMGFFSSHVLSALAPGLATFINHSTGTFRLVISPLITTEDYAAIREGTLTADDVARGYIEDLIVTEDLIHRHTLKCLAWLIRTGRIDIRIAIMKDALFHPKVWLFHMKDDQCIAAHGSSNLTSAGLLKNVEQVSIAASWGSKDQLYTVDTFKDQFRRLWAGTDTNCEVVALPVAIKHNLLATYSSDAPPREQDLAFALCQSNCNTTRTSRIASKSKAGLVVATGSQLRQGPVCSSRRGGSRLVQRWLFWHPGNGYWVGEDHNFNDLRDAAL